MKGMIKSIVFILWIVFGLLLLFGVFVGMCEQNALLITQSMLILVFVAIPTSFAIFSDEEMK